MNEQANRPFRDIDRDIGAGFTGPNLKSAATTDTIGLWFAAAVVLAFLAAGVIVYRTANQDIRTASNDLPVAAKPGPVDAPPILPQH
jgi:hypothetical protein